MFGSSPTGLRSKNDRLESRVFGKSSEGSTGRLVQLCVDYFLFYVVTGLIVKFYTGSVDGAAPGTRNSPPP